MTSLLVNVIAQITRINKAGLLVSHRIKPTKLMGYHSSQMKAASL